jgi:hypothetical protein
MLDHRPAGVLTDDEIKSEIKSLVRRLEELRAEKTRRLISLDGDIGRRKDRTR